ncbi:MAG: preQ(1) synthase [Actinobacteria bacterium]|nr:preQ(1) synthase [Actinomycetota bacterium]
MELTVLGQTVRHPIDHVEVFPAPAHVTKVRFTTDELSSVCPVTEQPDVATVVIEYVPNEWCIESKSLKLYLWRFRDMPLFAEALAAEIANEVMVTVKPRHVKVSLTQRPRGGIEVFAEAERSAE